MLGIYLALAWIAVACIAGLAWAWLAHIARERIEARERAAAQAQAQYAARVAAYDALPERVQRATAVVYYALFD